MAPEKEPEDPDNFEFQKFLFDMTMRREAHERVLEDAERSLCDELRKALLDLSPNEYAVAVLNVVDVSHPLPDPPFPLDDEDLSGCPGWDDDPAGDAFEDHHSLRKAIASYGHMLHEVRAELIQARLDEGRNAADAGAAAPDVLDETAFQKALEGDPALETQQCLVREIQSKTEELDGRRPARRLSPREAPRVRLRRRRQVPSPSPAPRPVSVAGAAPAPRARLRGRRFAGATAPRRFPVAVARAGIKRRLSTGGIDVDAVLDGAPAPAARTPATAPAAVDDELVEPAPQPAPQNLEEMVAELAAVEAKIEQLSNDDGFMKELGGPSPKTVSAARALSDAELANVVDLGAAIKAAGGDVETARGRAVILPVGSDFCDVLQEDGASSPTLQT